MSLDSKGHADNLREFLLQLSSGESGPLPTEESWSEMIARIQVTQRIHEIRADTFDYFLEVLPPKWMRGHFFAFAEGQEPLQLFWNAADSADTFFTRRLTEEEIDQFCRLSGIPRDYGCY